MQYLDKIIDGKKRKMLMQQVIQNGTAEWKSGFEESHFFVPLPTHEPSLVLEKSCLLTVALKHVF